MYTNKEHTVTKNLPRVQYTKTHYIAISLLHQKALHAVLQNEADSRACTAYEPAYLSPYELIRGAGH